MEMADVLMSSEKKKNSILVAFQLAESKKIILRHSFIMLLIIVKPLNLYVFNYNYFLLCVFPL